MVPVTVTYMMSELSASSGSGRSYSSIFKFSVKDKIYRIRYRGKPYKEEGTQIEIYYAPDDPNVVYIPEIEKTKSKFFSAILLIYGFLFPVAALLVPLFA